MNEYSVSSCCGANIEGEGVPLKLFCVVCRKECKAISEKEFFKTAIHETNMKMKGGK